jgi:hypothetical protein
MFVLPDLGCQGDAERAAKMLLRWAEDCSKMMLQNVELFQDVSNNHPKFNSPMVPFFSREHF